MQFKNVKVYGLDSSIIRSGYPHQIGEPRDLDFIPFLSDCTVATAQTRSKKLAKAPVGSGHDNFLKGIIVQADIRYPQYFTPQLQRYHWIDIISSQSKMHSLTKIKDIKNSCNKYVIPSIISEVNDLIECYNTQDKYPLTYPCNILENDGYGDLAAVCITINSKQELFQYIISNLPMGFELWMGISSNYLQMKTIWNQRCKHKHKLEEWAEFGEFIKSLPMSELITNE